MKRIIVLLAVFLLMGCGAIVDTAKQVDSNMASYLGVESLSLDCKAGLAQADQDILPESAPATRVAALVKYANKDSDDYKKCYSGYAWLSYVGKKAESSFKSFVSKLTELGILSE